MKVKREIERNIANCKQKIILILTLYLGQKRVRKQNPGYDCKEGPFIF